MSRYEDLVALADAGGCTGACLLAKADEVCSCRCLGDSHGALRGVIENDSTREQDPLLNMCFHILGNRDCGYRYTETQGFISARVDAAHYIFTNISWWDGSYTHSQIVSLDSMTDWHLYESDKSMRRAFKGSRTREQAHRDKCQDCQEKHGKRVWA